MDCPSDHRHHAGHEHRHGPGCGHSAVRHGDHSDYLHDGHLHCESSHDGEVDEHAIEVDRRHPAACAPVECGETHGPTCGHEAVPHGSHVDYLVDGTLHHPHGDHCDLHGPLFPG